MTEAREREREREREWCAHGLGPAREWATWVTTKSARARRRSTAAENAEDDERER